MKVFEIVNDIILKKLEAGTVPWQKPWVGQENAPRNLISGKAYRGINSFILGSSGYASPYWLTFKQAVSLKGMVRKGEHGTPIFFWNFIDKVKSGGEGQKDKTDRIPFLRYYTAFNVAQCDLPEGAVPVIETREHTVLEQNEAAEMVLEAYEKKPLVLWGSSNQASYSPYGDTVNLPAREAFLSAPGMYSTLFHELGHSTGHESRLNRLTHEGFGSKGYAREELIAEMCAAYLCGECGIEGSFDASAAYLKSWMEALKDDEYLFITAAGKAQAAVDYMLGRNKAEEEGSVA